MSSYEYHYMITVLLNGFFNFIYHKGIALYIKGKLYTYAIYLICIDSDTCMHRSEQRAVASTCLEFAEHAKGARIEIQNKKG